MAEFDPLATQRDAIVGITAELDAAGFEDAQEIGRGGFGVVYRCRQPELDRTVAIKVLTADLDPENLERFLREQRAMGQLSGHPHIVNILQVGATGSGRPYIVMQCHLHGSLDSRVRRYGPLEWGEALSVGVKLAGALETAHRIGTLHRDVKPANILLTAYGEPQLTDFGIARVAGGFETTTGTVTGSPAFTAPEIMGGHKPTPASDVYSLGATLFCAITGHAAFERRSGEQVVAQFLRITTQPVPDLRDRGIPDLVSAAISRAMAGHPADRPATAIEFGEKLREAQRRNGLSVDEMALPTMPEDEQPGEHARGTRWTVSGPTNPRTTGVSRRPTAMTPPTPATKYRPPIPAKALVGRARLIEALRAGQWRRLTVIHAPTGYGKSTLAAQWCEALAADGVAVAWLTVDRDDDNVVWFLAHLIEAIRRVRPQLARELGAALEEHGDQAERYVLTALINEIHETSERVAVVIDDWHRVTNPATIAALEFLLDNGCHHLQLIVTSRTQAGLPLSRMRVRDELVEIDSAALRFSTTESHSFLVGLGGLDLETEDVADLTASTDGWVAALQLVSLSLRGADDPAQLIGHLSGRHHAIGEFLAENVLSTLEPRILDFLLATSVTERICAPLACTLTEVDGGQALLEEIEERDLFLCRLDEDREWFRYHHLFAQFLQRRLERDHPGRLEVLHRAASGWFADHHLVGEAVDHALAAGDGRRAVELVERDGMHLIEHSQFIALLALVDKLPPTIVASSPRLQLTIAWANIRLHRAGPTQRALARIDNAFERSALTDTAIAELRVEIDLVKATMRLRADRIEGIDELVSEALSRPDTLTPWLVSNAANIATFAALYRFDFEEVRRLQDWALGYHEANDAPYNMMHGHCYRGIAASEQLDLTAAEDSFRRALHVARRSGGIHSHAARLACALLGELLYERGEIVEAERLLDESYQLGSEGGGVDFKLARYVIGARIKALRGDRGEAGRRLAECALAAETLSLPRLRAKLENERVRLGLPVAPGIEARTPVEYAARQRPVDGIEEITAQLEEATAIRLLLDEDSPERVDLACEWVTEWEARLEGRGRDRALLQAKRLLVACLATAERTDEAKSLLASIAAQCAEQSMVRYPLDGGPQVVPLLRALRDDQLAGRWPPDWPTVPRPFIDSMLEAAVLYTR
ncbi:protein kinase [Rhodococcus sp. NPDC059968]|uniref:protein kinase domain-containing protein n=1 Tax=Rhodococcus sp. NPDC059968 TaxID=3347017 RepID=UPI00366C0591